ncbi:MAG: phospholipase [Methanobacterium sp.]|nr:phospholipase [Methanobacterium sp.]
MNFNKIFNLMTVFMISLLIMMPSSDAWSWETHSQIVDVVYHGLPSYVQRNLNLEIMENASNDPDEIFHDFTYHSYPKSYNKSVYWLNLGKTAYDAGDYQNASYDYGVACHYISDTFSAPHGVSGESSSLHSKYEDHAKKFTPVASHVSGDLNSLMENGKIEDSKSWDSWIQTNDDSIIEKNLSNGTSICLQAVKTSVTGNSSGYVDKKSESIFNSILNFLYKLFG